MQVVAAGSSHATVKEFRGFGGLHGKALQRQVAGGIGGLSKLCGCSGCLIVRAVHPRATPSRTTPSQNKAQMRSGSCLTKPCSVLILGVGNA